MNIQKLLFNISGVKHPSLNPIYIPLLSRKNRTIEPVSIEGNKLIVGTAGTGVSFFTKYLVHKCYEKAKVLIVDASNTFGWYRDGFQPWFTTINRFEVPGEKVNGIPSSLIPPDWNTSLDYMLPPGLTVINARPNWEWEEKENYFTFLQKVLLQFANQPYSPDTPTILVLDQLWHQFIFDKQVVTPLRETLNDLLKTARKFNREIWLLDDGGFYGLVDQKRGIPLQYLQKIVANVHQCCLLEHKVWNHHCLNSIRTLYNLNETEYDLLQSVNRNLDPSLPPYKEVFISSATRNEVYGVVAPNDELNTYAPHLRPPNFNELVQL